MQEIFNRILTGNKVEEAEHEALIYETSLELVDAYDIFFDPEALIPLNPDMTDRVYGAAIELLEKVGVFSVNTKRVVKLSRNEIIRGIHNTRKSLNLGDGIDAVSVSHRDILDNRMPLIMGGPNAAPISPEFYSQIHRSYIKLNAIDSLAPGSFHGSSVHKAKNSPVNLYDAHKSLDILKEACALEGRPNICMVTPPSIADPVSAISIANHRYMGPGDLQEIIHTLDLKVTYDELLRLSHYKTVGYNYLCSNMLVMGGVSSAYPEQFAIEMVAEALKTKLIYSGSAYFKYPVHMKYAPSASLDTLWASFVASMALSRNTHYLHGSVVHNSSGPCTEMMMYETAIQTIGYVVCGDEMLSGPVSNGGNMINHSAGLDALFMADIANFATKLSLGDANFLCLEIYDRYKDMIDNPSAGQAFVDCYDPENIEPSDEYLEIYDKVMGGIYGIMNARYVRKTSYKRG